VIRVQPEVYPGKSWQESHRSGLILWVLIMLDYAGLFPLALAHGEDSLRVPRSSQTHCGGLVFFLDFAQRACTALRADSLRC
jgi:hypothetical protein